MPDSSLSKFLGCASFLIANFMLSPRDLVLVVRNDMSRLAPLNNSEIAGSRRLNALNPILKTAGSAPYLYATRIR